MRLKLRWLALLNVMTIILLASLWEYGAEAWVSKLLGLSYDSDFETAERLKFIMTSASFALLAMVVPGLLVGGLMRKLLRTEQAATRMAHVDELTGVGNRRAFQVRTEQLDNLDVVYAIMMIDVNDFKIINDLNGHHQGDATLVALASLLMEFTGPQTHVFRIGGDEFALITVTDSTDALMAEAEEIRTRAGKIMTGPASFLSLSIGIARSTDCSTYSIIQAADLAMYQAKGGKGAQLALFTPDMERQFRQKEMFECSVANAVRNNAVVPFLQPILTLSTGKLAGFEILSRWTLPSGEVVAPQVFIPVVQKLGLMDQLTVQLLRAVSVVASEWAGDLTLALNITPEQLIRPSLTDRLYTIIRDAGALRLELEVTENDVMSISEEARQAIERLKERDIRVSLDDFGTGYSNLSVLLGLGISKIKIDRSFISAGMNNREQKKVVETLLALCRELGVEVTAEGIEDIGTLMWLKQQGCNYGQGYLFRKAIPVNEATSLLPSVAFALPVKELPANDHGHAAQAV